MTQLSGWPETFALTCGCRFTVSGVFRRRTFWQWLMRRPRELEVFVLGPDLGQGGTACR